MGKLRRVWKPAVRAAIASAPGWRAARAVLQPRGVGVLTYHRVGSDGFFPGLGERAFEAHMEWLARHCRIIAPADFEDEVRHSGGRRPGVLVTFDDGFRDYHDVAYPILKRLGIPSVVFLATGLMDDGGMLWPDLVWLAFHRTARREVRLPWSETPTDVTSRTPAEVAEGAKAYLKSVPDKQRRELLDALLVELEVSAADLELDRQMLSWDEVRSVMDITLLGGHTHTHPVMSRLDRTGLEMEIGQCRDRLVAETGLRPRFFAYPNGRFADFTADTKEALHRYGFEVAFCTEKGVAGPGTEWMEVRRLPCYGSAADLAMVLLGR